MKTPPDQPRTARFATRAFLGALATALAMLGPAPLALAQSEQQGVPPVDVVTICHANPDDSFTAIVVPVGDPQIAEHSGHPGDVILEGDVGCPATEPVPPDDDDLEPPCDDPCPEEQQTSPDVGAQAPTPVAAEPIRALPRTGLDGVSLSLVFAGLLGTAFGLRRAARRLD